MTTETKILGGVLGLSLLLVIGFVFLFSNNNSKPAAQTGQVYEIDYSLGQKIGSDSAKIKLVEFSDFQCPACKAYEPYVKDIKEKYKNDLQFIYRHFPLTQHANAKEAANLSEYAAENGKFWEVHAILFDTQSEWENLSDPSDYFADIAMQVGLDKDAAKEAVVSGKYNEKIDNDLAAGYRYGISSTPTFFLNGKKLQINNFTDLDLAISNELESSGQ